MSVVDAFEVRAAGAQPARVRHRRRWWSFSLLDVLVLAVLVRVINMMSAYDVYVDEFIYRDMGRSVSHGNVPPLDSDGLPFLVHPPGLFVLEAGWTALVGQKTDLYDQIASLRLLQTVLALVSVALLYLVVLRATSTRAPALLAAALFACDPYIIRQNGRILLITAAMVFVLAGYAVLVRWSRRPDRSPHTSAVACGLLFGLAIVTLDMTAGVTVLPLLVMLAMGWGPYRRHLLLALAASTVPYAAYAVTATLQGFGAALWSAKTAGLERMIGLDVYTGYNANGSPSVADTFVSRLLTYGVSFALMGLGLCGAVLLVSRPRYACDRALALFTLSGTAIVAYGALFSTIEEHFLYLQAVAAIVTLTVAGTRLWEAGWLASRRRGRRVLVVALSAMLVLVPVLDAVSWARTRFEPDDAHWRAVMWLRRNVPRGETVAIVAGQTQDLMQGTGIRAVPLGTPTEMAANRVTYLVLMEKLVDEGYTEVTRTEARWYLANGTVEFTASGRSYGRVVVVRSTDVTVW